MRAGRVCGSPRYHADTHGERTSVGDVSFPWTTEMPVVYSPAPTSRAWPRLGEGGYRMRSTRLALALALSFGIVATAGAGTYSSPILRTFTANTQLHCVVSNVGNSPANVTITLYDGFGVVVPPNSNGCVVSYAGVLPAGASCASVVSGPHILRCTAEVSSSKVRAVLQAYSPSTTEVLSNVPLTKK